MTKRILTKASLPPFCFFFSFLLYLFALSGAQGEILASDNFEYGDGSDLSGAEGGSGKWVGSWRLSRGSLTAAENFTIQASQGSGASLLAKGAGSGKRLYILRSFEDYTGEKIFVRFKIEAQELPDEASSFYFFFQAGELFTTAYRLSMGIKEGTLMARYYPDKGGTRKGPPAEIGKTYVLVGEFSKSTGGDFDTVKFWVDPGPNDYFSNAGEVALPTGSAAGEPGRKRIQSVNTLGFALEGGQPGSVRIRDLVIATDWSEVVGPHQ